MSLSAAAMSALEWLAPQRAAMEMVLAALVNQNSFTQNRPGVNAVVTLLESELRQLPSLTVERVPGQAFGDHLTFATRAPSPLTDSVVLIGHTDTVFPPGTFEGWTVTGDLARGPGTFDMKGGLVVTLFALKALEHAGLLATTAIRGLWVSDEEVGSPESEALLRRLAAKASCALDFESGRAGDGIVTARKGVASLKVEATGVLAHAGNEHDKGRNAIWALARFVDRAQALTNYAQGITVNVGRIEGGTSKNTVPAHARADIDTRFLTLRDGEALIQSLQALTYAPLVEGTQLVLQRGPSRPPMERTPASAALAQEYGEEQRACGLGSGEAPLVGGGSDAATTSSMGIPSIDGLGPRGKGFHTHDEEIDLRTLVPKAQALVRFLARRAKA